MFRAMLFLVLAAVVFATGCERSPIAEGGGPPAKAPGTNQQIFQVRGVVIEVKPLAKSIKIKHEDVPDYMPAMTTPFDVKKSSFDA